MIKRSRRAATRTRQRNHKERTLLELTLRSVDADQKRSDELLTNEIRKLEISVYCSTIGKRAMEHSGIKSPDITNTETIPLPQIDSCKYTATTPYCHHYPCLLPRSYTSLQSNVYDSSSVTSRHVTKPRKENTLLTLGVAPVSFITRRERALAAVVREMRMRNESLRPGDRAVKYGTPIPRRKLTNAIRPS